MKRFGTAVIAFALLSTPAFANGALVVADDLAIISTQNIGAGPGTAGATPVGVPNNPLARIAGANAAPAAGAGFGVGGLGGLGMAGTIGALSFVIVAAGVASGANTATTGTQ